MEQNEFKEPIEILFDEWKPNWNWIKLTLYKFQNAEEITLDKSVYWVFNGRIETRDNPLRIENGAMCRFWFSKRMFKREIQRHLLLHTYPWDNPFDITIEIKRPSKFSLLMRNVELILSSYQMD